MRRIHQLFESIDQQSLRRLTSENHRTRLCWYPSAGMDFRHIKFLEEDGLSKHNLNCPLVYLHSDIRLPKSKGASFDLPFIKKGGVEPNLKIIQCSEIHPKKKDSSISEDVCTFDADDDTGRVFLIELELTTTCFERSIKVPIPVLFAANKILKVFFGFLFIICYTDFVINCENNSIIINNSEFI